MNNPTFPNNPAEIPNITFQAVKDSCNKIDHGKKKNNTSLNPQEDKLLGLSGDFNSFLEELQIDYVRR